MSLNTNQGKNRLQTNYFCIVSEKKKILAWVVDPTSRTTSPGQCSRPRVSLLVIRETWMLDSVRRGG